MKTQAQPLRIAPALPAFVQEVILSVSAALAARRARRESEAQTAALFEDPGFIAEFGHASPTKQDVIEHLTMLTPGLLAATVHGLPRNGRR